MGAIVATSTRASVAAHLALMEHRGASSHETATDAWTLGARGFEADLATTRGGTACALDGEIFNARALKSELAEDGVRFLEDSPALIVAYAFEAWGTAAFAKLDGPFAIALGSPDGSITIARDPLGEKPVYHTRIKSVFSAASEIKSFLADPSFVARPNLASLNKLLVFSFVPGEESMFEGVFELPPATCLTARADGTTSTHTYWSLSENHAPRSEEEWQHEIESLVRTATKKRLGDKKHVAASLSGGIDSSAVVAILRDLGAEVTAFSASFGHGQPNELMFARAVANHTGAEHRVIDVEPDQFLDLLPHIMWSLDDPLCDCITVPNFLLAREAAKQADLVFNGEGGDPLFGGPKNKFLILGEWYAFLGHYDRARAYLSSYHKFYDYLPELYTPAFMERVKGSAPLEAFVRPYLDDERITHFLNRLMQLNIKLKGGQNILVKVDKMLSANGVRPASPLFDKKLTEQSFAIPTSLKRRGDVEKWIFKKAVEKLLPRAVVYRKKAGMGVPLNFWFKVTKLRDYAKDILLSRRTHDRGYFKPDFVSDLLEQRGPRTHVGQPRHGELLWMLLAIEIWHRVYIDGENQNARRAS